MSLLVQYLEEWLQMSKEKNMRLRFIGDRSVFSDKIRQLMERVERESAPFRNQLNLALNYGARSELATAFTALASEGKKTITPEDISDHLYTKGQPDVDLLIRTGGEVRLSNFLLFQSAYAELYFTDRLWPDMSRADIDEAISYFNRRERRFGAVIERNTLS